VRPDVSTHAHDLNGVLGAILATADFAATRKRDGDATRTAFENIATSARKAGGLVESLVRAATVSDAGTDSAYERDLAYLERIHPPIDAVMSELERKGRDAGIPIVDRETGRFLSVLVSATGAANILEIGTAFGHSTLWMARAQSSGGRVVTIDPDKDRTAVAAGFFKQAGVAERITIVNEPALAVLPTLPKDSFDLVFIDALKEEYPQYLRASLPLLKKSGMVVADNLLWGHAAAQAPGADDPATTKAIRRFNEELLGHPQLNATIVPIGDGLGVAAKIA
jgi:predicted O-methyltransferase YrrM